MKYLPIITVAVPNFRGDVFEGRFETQVQFSYILLAKLAQAGLGRLSGGIDMADLRSEITALRFGHKVDQSDLSPFERKMIVNETLTMLKEYKNG